VRLEQPRTSIPATINSQKTRELILIDPELLVLTKELKHEQNNREEHHEHVYFGKEHNLRR
jgi:hypothetical protein